MIFIIVSFLLCAIFAWFMALDDEKQEKREMREFAWKLLALAAVAELKNEMRRAGKMANKEEKQINPWDLLRADVLKMEVEE